MTGQGRARDASSSSESPERPEGRSIVASRRRLHSDNTPDERTSAERRGEYQGRRDWYAVTDWRLPPILNGQLPSENTGLPAGDPQMQAYAYVRESPVQDYPSSGRHEDMSGLGRVWVVTEGGGPNGEHRFTIDRLTVLRSRGKGWMRAFRHSTQRGRFYWWIPLSEQ